MDLVKNQKDIKNLILFKTPWKNKSTRKLFTSKVLKRIKLYKKLVLGSFDSVLKSIYPNCYKLLKGNWNNLVQKYIEKFPPNTPILNKVAARFPDFLKSEKKILKKYPFISELALYEWKEIEIYEKEDIKSNGKLNPVHEICKFKYPIPSIIENIETKRQRSKEAEKESSTSVLIYRDPKTLEVRFFELTYGTLVYLELLRLGLTDKEAKEDLIKIFKIDKSKKQEFERSLLKLKTKLRNNRILLN